MRKHILKQLTPEKAEQLEQLRREVKRFDDKGLHDTAHHEMLARLESELGLIPDKKDTRDTTIEVNNG